MRSAHCLAKPCSTRCSFPVPAPSAVQLAEVLSKLVRMLAEVGATAAKRAPVLALVEELAEARSESEWLRDYDNDDNR